MSNRERAYRLITRVCQIPVGSPEFNAAVYAAELAFEAAIAENIADSRRLDKVERLRMCIDSPLMGINTWLVMSDNGDGLAATLREAIDGVPE